MVGTSGSSGPALRQIPHFGRNLLDGSKSADQRRYGIPTSTISFSS
jgi:hypothetical protein